MNKVYSMTQWFANQLSNKPEGFLLIHCIGDEENLIFTTTTKRSEQEFTNLFDTIATNHALKLNGRQQYIIRSMSNEMVNAIPFCFSKVGFVS